MKMISYVCIYHFCIWQGRKNTSTDLVDLFHSIDKVVGLTYICVATCTIIVANNLYTKYTKYHPITVGCGYGLPAQSHNISLKLHTFAGISPTAKPAGFLAAVLV